MKTAVLVGALLLPTLAAGQPPPTDENREATLVFSNDAKDVYLLRALQDYEIEVAPPDGVMLTRQVINRIGSMDVTGTAFGAAFTRQLDTQDTWTVLPGRTVSLRVRAGTIFLATLDKPTD